MATKAADVANGGIRAWLMPEINEIKVYLARIEGEISTLEAEVRGVKEGDIKALHTEIQSLKDNLRTEIQSVKDRVLSNVALHYDATVEVNYPRLKIVGFTI